MYGIRNGIDQEIWDPSADEFLPVQVGERERGGDGGWYICRDGGCIE